MSQLNSLIPPEIRSDALYDLIVALAANEQLTSVLEIGSSAGGGSTQAFVAGLARNTGNPKLFCVEVSKVRFEKLRDTYAAYPFVYCYNLSSVTVEEFPKKNVVEEFYRTVDSGLHKFELDQVLGWLDQDVSYVRDSGVEGGAIEKIKVEHGIEYFDMVLIDGSEFTGEVEYEKIKGAGLILLDDTNTFKCWNVRQRLLADPMYEVIADDQTLRNGYSAFRRRRMAKPSSQTLPIHFLTIVLNGEPFIRCHEKMLAKLELPWHWHVVEGVAALKHDTAWSVAGGGRVADELHDRGRSKDGTTTYLDDLARRFPDRVTVYRKPHGEFWDGKLEMVNAPIPNLGEECLLWQMDSDELWTIEQIEAVHQAFMDDPERSAAFYWCWYYVGPDKIISTRYNYAQNPNQEWLRTWRFRPGARWAAHEPPILVEPDLVEPGKTIDVAKKKPFRHDETERLGAVFQHLAYATEEQLAFKEVYYGYKGARAKWRALQAHKGSGQLKDYFDWVSDNTVFDDARLPYLIDPIAQRDEVTGEWHFDPGARLGRTGPAALKRPRIALDAIFWQYLSSGIGRVWENVLREWVKSGFIDQVLVLDRGGTAPRIPGVHYWTVPRHTYAQTGYDSLYLDEVCGRFDIDLFVSTYYSCTAGTPSFFSGHDMIPEVLGFPMQEECWHEKRRAILHATGHSMVSQSAANDLERIYPGLPKGSTRIAHNGVAPEFFQPQPQQVKAFREKYGLHDKPYVMMVGERLGYGGYKNGGLVFRALAILPAHRAPTLLCVGGHPEIEQELLQLAPGLDVRRLRLDDEELRSAYGGAHALLYPSRYEGFGMPPLEAMACGAPAIVCRNSSLPEVAGDAALYVDENEPGDLLHALVRLEDPALRAELIERGLKQAKKFTFEATARTLADALLKTYHGLGAAETRRATNGWQEVRRLVAERQNAPVASRVEAQAASAVPAPEPATAMPEPVSALAPAPASAPAPRSSSMTVSEHQTAAMVHLQSEVDRAVAELLSMRKSPFWKARQASVGLLRWMKLRTRP